MNRVSLGSMQVEPVFFKPQISCGIIKKWLMRPRAYLLFLSTPLHLVTICKIIEKANFPWVKYITHLTVGTVQI